MLDAIFPTQGINRYRGHTLAKWVFILITFITLVRSLIHKFAPDGGAQSIATIPSSALLYKLRRTPRAGRCHHAVA